MDIQGWLELAWEDAPHLLVAGVNEGQLPEAIHGDLFLPNTLRELLGLRTNADRLARDTWLMELLLATRAESGKVEFLWVANVPMANRSSRHDCCFDVQISIA